MTSMKPAIEMLSRSFDFAKKKTGLQVGERTLQESPLTEKVSFTSLWGIQPLACRSSQFPVGKMTKRWLGRYQHGKAVPPKAAGKQRDFSVSSRAGSKYI